MKAGKVLRKGFDEFIKLLKIPETQITSLKSHALPYGNYLATPGHDNILMIGDACGLADPLLGEGIYYAHKSAQAAVKAAIESYYYPNAALSKYTQLLRQTVITDLKFARIGRQIIFSLPGIWPYKVIVSLLKKRPKKCEQIIQGQRSFKWLRPLDNEFCNLKL